MATQTADAADTRPRVQRYPLAGEPRRRLKLGTGYPHRGPAPASRQPFRVYQALKPGTASPVGRLLVLQPGRNPAQERP